MTLWQWLCDIKWHIDNGHVTLNDTLTMAVWHKMTHWQWPYNNEMTRSQWPRDTKWNPDMWQHWQLQSTTLPSGLYKPTPLSSVSCRQRTQVRRLIPPLVSLVSLRSCQVLLIVINKHHGSDLHHLCRSSHNSEAELIHRSLNNIHY